MRALLLLAVCCAACGHSNDDDTRGPLQKACDDVAIRFCCGADHEYDCYVLYSSTACTYVGGSGQCIMGHGSCVRSSIDFAACNAALDADPDLCLDACIEGADPATCFEFPAECISKKCLSPSDGCAEDPNETSPYVP